MSYTERVRVRVSPIVMFEVRVFRAEQTHTHIHLRCRAARCILSNIQLVSWINSNVNYVRFAAVLPKVPQTCVDMS